MKKVFSLLLTLLACLPSRASEYEDGITKAFVTEYAKEQIKERVANFVNANPHLVFSNDKTIGTEAMGVISKAMALHNLMEAPNDKSRFWAGVSLIPADPVTSMIIFSVQIADTLMTMKHHEAMTKIRQEITEIQARESALRAQYETDKSNSLYRILGKFDGAWEQIKSEYVHITKSALFVYVTSEDKSSLPVPNEEQIKEAIDRLFKIELAFRELDNALIYIQYMFDRSTVSSPDGFYQKAVDMAEKHRPIRMQIQSAREVFLKIFATAKAKTAMARIEKDLQPYKGSLKRYAFCVERLNVYTTRRQVNPHWEDIDELSIIEDCQEKFNLSFGEALEVN